MPGQKDLTILQGANFEEQFTLQDSLESAINLTGYTARMQVRADVNSETEIFELTTENSKLVLGGINGTIDISLSASETAAAQAVEAVYDVELISSGGQVYRILSGNISIIAEVTR